MKSRTRKNVDPDIKVDRDDEKEEVKAERGKEVKGERETKMEEVKVEMEWDMEERKSIVHLTLPPPQFRKHTVSHFNN